MIAYFSRAVFALASALLGSLIIAVPAAAVWGHNGPDWPLVPLAVLSALGLVAGWRISGRLYG